jgi:hypothetical protein
MNSSIATAILLLLVILPAAAQNDLLPGRIPISEVIRRELAMGSIPEDSTLYSKPPDFYRQPIVFKRTAGKFKPYPTVKYYFSRLDSLPFRIQYGWDPNGDIDYSRSIDTTALLATEPMSRVTEYFAQYESLKSELVSRYGEPPLTVTIGDEDFNTGRGMYGWSRGRRWEGAGVTIDIHMTFTDSTAPRRTYGIWIDQQWD